MTACVLGGAIGLDSNCHSFQNNLAQESQESGHVGTHSSLFATVSFIEHYALIKKIIKEKSFWNQFDLNITPLASAFLR